jgi:hypothetical protein
MAVIFICYRYEVIIVLQRAKTIFRCIPLYVHYIEKCLNEKSYILMYYV